MLHPLIASILPKIMTINISNIDDEKFKLLDIIILNEINYFIIFKIRNKFKYIFASCPYLIFSHIFLL